jgi:acetyl esterase/lipase
MGHSSGGHVAALLAADPDIAALNGATPWLGTVVLDSGGYDVPRIMNAQHMRFYDQAFGDNPAFWRESSPIHRLSGTPAPMLLVCSSRSRNACDWADDFAEKIDESGGGATVLPIALSHMAINNDLGLPGQYTEAVDSFLKSLGLP